MLLDLGTAPCCDCEPPSQGLGPRLWEEGSTSAGHGSQVKYCSHIPASRTVLSPSPCYPCISLPPRTRTGSGDPGGFSRQGGDKTWEGFSRQAESWQKQCKSQPC